MVSVNERVDGFASDYMKVPIDADLWRSWGLTAGAAGITDQGIAGLARLRIVRKAEEAGVTFRLGPELTYLFDPVSYCVLANGVGLTTDHVNAALAELTEQAETASAVTL